MEKEKTNRVANDDMEKRTTLSLSLTVNDKKALKMYAAEHETTIAAVIHEWIQEKCLEVKE
jgi:glutamate-1-semialdehyde aminotransferase